MWLFVAFALTFNTIFDITKREQSNSFTYFIWNNFRLI